MTDAVVITRCKNSYCRKCLHRPIFTFIHNNIHYIHAVSVFSRDQTHNLCISRTMRYRPTATVEGKACMTFGSLHKRLATGIWTCCPSCNGVACFNCKQSFVPRPLNALAFVLYNRFCCVLTFSRGISSNRFCNSFQPKWWIVLGLVQLLLLRLLSQQECNRQ